ncbi:MAG: cold shock domain-containing protein [Acidimicrobiia bacterium]|nr:cold shock domain-containing protein [Acidimicrobiia bacterium]
MARGVVATFDDDGGWGTIDTGEAGVVAFHCTAVAGGSRHVDVGVPVVFQVVPGRSGRWEAARVEPVV